MKIKFLHKLLLVCLACALGPLLVAGWVGLEAARAPAAPGQLTRVVLGLTLSLGAALALAIAGAAWLHADLQRMVQRLQSAGRKPPDHPGELPDLAAQLAEAGQRLTRAAGQPAERLATLYHASQAITQSLDPEQIYAATYAAVGQLMPNEAFAITLLDASGDHLEAVYLIDRGERLPPQRQPAAAGLTGHLLQVGQPVVFNSAAEWPPGVVHFGTAASVESVLAVPMKVGAQVFGVMACEAYQRSAFSPDDIPLLSLLANQAAVAIQHARQFQAVQRQVAQFSILQEVAQAAVPGAGLEAIVRCAAEALQRHAGYSHLGVYLLAPGGATTRYGWPDNEADTATCRDLVGKVVAGGKPHRETEPGSAVCVPLKAGERAIGALCTRADAPGVFSADDERLLTIVAGLLAPLVENVRLYEAARRRAERMHLVNEIGREFAGILDVRTLFGQMCRRLETAFGYYHAKLGLIEGDEVVFPARPAEAGTAALPELRWGVDGPGLIAWAARNSQPRYVADVLAEPDFVPNPDLAETRAEAAVPLVAHGRTLGVLDVQSKRPGEFGPEDMATLEAVGGLVAAAVDNARLYAEAQQRTVEISSLLDTALEVSSSLDLAGRLESIAQHARELVEADSCTIYRLGPEGRHLLPLVAHDPYAEQILGHQIPLGEGVVGYVAQSGIGELVNRADLDPRAKQIPGTPLTPESLMAIPLLVGTRVTGVMAVYRDGRREFTSHHFGLLSSFAAQAALSLENAELYQAVRDRADTLLSAYNELTEMDRHKDEIVQNISHELRTPLTFLKSYVELLLAGDLGPLQPAQERSLRVVLNKTDSLVRLVGDIITLEAVTPATLNMQPVDLARLARAAAAGVEATTRAAGLDLVVEVPTEPVEVIGDAHRLMQVFDNLLGNAAKFTERGHIALRVLPQGERVRVEVADTGLGVPPEYAERIFDRFYQADGTLARRRGGIGLGLAICKLIVDVHGGSIGVESQPGAGSCFYFTLRRQRDGAPPGAV